MANRGDILISATTAEMYTYGGLSYSVQANNGYYYIVYIHQGNIFYRKSVDKISWGQPVAIFTSGVGQALATWYGRWSNIADDKIYIVYTDSGDDNVTFITLDTATDTLGSPVTILSGTSTATGGAMSITLSRSGYIYVAYSIDAGAEYDTVRSTDAGANWTSIAEALEGATQDQWILLPDWNNADTNDCCMIFWDASANEISVKRYDSGGDSWAETSISGSMTDITAVNSFPHFAAACDIANSQNILVAWTAVDSANADLLCWTITESTITAKTDVITNSGDDQGLAALGIDTATGYWYCAYGGASDGSETWETSVNVYYKVSQDAGTTWGAETKITQSAISLQCLFTSMRFINHYAVTFIHYYTGAVNLQNLYFSANILQPRATFQLGM